MLDSEYRYINVVEYCAKEVARQGDGPMSVFHMFKAWTYAKDVIAYQENMATEEQIKVLHMFVRNLDILRNYRVTPVTFSDGSHGLDWPHIPRQMDLLITEGMNPRGSLTLDEWIKAFLMIHPFEDGNGRVASLLWNVGNGTILDPRPMPIYFGNEVYA
jgi:hypothetical protein